MEDAAGEGEEETTREAEKEVRADWSPSEQNISSFLAANESFKKKLRFVPDREPYLINLLEEVATVDDEDDE
ncbi:MAG TPA: hypothetical protein VJ656_00310 [Pyrinomonadaceae bacterium]|nr:hypothetical protein [Pyrinomonadaceae bacterium]